MIERLRSGAGEAVAVMDSSRRRTQDCVTQAGRAGEALAEISRAVSIINDMNIQIAIAAEEQSAVGEEINNSASQIAQIVDQSHTERHRCGPGQRSASAAVRAAETAGRCSASDHAL